MTQSHNVVQQRIIEAFRADREYCTKRIMGYYCDLMPISGREFLKKVMEMMISEEMVQLWAEHKNPSIVWLSVICAEDLKDNTRFSARNVGAWEEAQRVIRKGQASGDIGSFGAAALEREYQKQCNDR